MKDREKFNAYRRRRNEDIAQAREDYRLMIVSKYGLNEEWEKSGITLIAFLKRMALKGIIPIEEIR